MIADLLEDVVRITIEDGIRVVGVGVLKVATFGRYRSAGHSALLVEGAIGLAAIAAVATGLVWWVW